jgi:hypothetical protein
MGQRRHGFILWIVITILLVTALLAFSLNLFKTGEIFLLGRSFDQNRMMAVAKSALHEVLVKCRFQANRPSGPGGIQTRFRRIFAQIPSGKRSPDLPFCDPESTWTYDLADLPQTKAIIDRYRLDFTASCRARIVYNREVNRHGSSVFRGFLELLAVVSHQGKPVYRLQERREILAADLTDFFDRYALFVKFYPGWDVNRVDRRMTVTPISPDAGFRDFSRIYLGKEGHPGCSGAATEKADSDHAISLDLSFNNGNHPGDASGKGYANAFLTKIFPDAAPVAISPIDTSAQSPDFQTMAFLYHIVPWTSFAGNSPEIFDFIGIKRHYIEAIVKPAIANDPNDPKYGSFSAAHLFVKDFDKRQPKYSPDDLLSDDGKMHQSNFSACEGYQMMVNFYRQHWQYHFAYVGAESIWNLEAWESGTPNIKAWHPFVNSTPALKHYSGIRKILEYASATPGGEKNIAKLQVGRMQKFMGPDGTIPVLMEGDVYLRFFKTAFFDEFSDTVQLWNVSMPLRAPPVPMPFAKPGSPVPGEKFLHMDRRPLIKELGPKVAGSAYPMESALMSRVIDNIPFNRLLGPVCTDVTPAVSATGRIDPNTAPTVIKPTSSSGASALNMYPIISPSAFSHIYDSGEAFLANHCKDDPTHIHLDGHIMIRKGDLKLRNVRTYSGCGLIRVNTGNIELEDLAPAGSRGMPCKLTLFALSGKIKFQGGSGPRRVQASLVAVSFNPESLNQGRGLGMCDFGGAKDITIHGNLIVDHLNLASLGVGGHLQIIHDPHLFSIPPNQRYRVSISRAKTLFALDSAAGDAEPGMGSPK